MTTLFLNGCNTYSSEQVTPQWMREERYGYCEPFIQPAQTLKSLWNKLLNLFR